DRGAALLRDALVVLVEDPDLPPEDAALGVDDVLEDLHAVLDLRALHHRPGRRLRQADADEDGVLLCQRGQGEPGGRCQRGERADARNDHGSTLKAALSWMQFTRHATAPAAGGTRVPGLIASPDHGPHR